MSVQPNHAPAALHSWRERRYPPPHPNEKVQKMREAQHGKAGDLPLPGPPIAAALDQLDEDGYVRANFCHLHFFREPLSPS